MAVIIQNAIKFNQGGRTFYLGWLSLKDIRDSVFVPVKKKTVLPHNVERTPLEEREEDGYQRNAQISRQRKISTYYEENPNAIIPPVLLSDRGNWSFSEADKSITINQKATIVDGQHRLGGLSLLFDKDSEKFGELKVPFNCVAGLTVENEKAEFLKINNTQKGVSGQHSAWISPEIWSNACALKLNEEGPFRERIVVQQRQPWQLQWNLHSIAKGIKDTFGEKKDPAQDYWKFEDDEDRKDKVPDILIDYWNCVTEIFDQEYADLDMLPDPHEEIPRGQTVATPKHFNYKLLELTGYLVFMSVLRHYAPDFYYPENNSFDQSKVRKYLHWIKEETYVDNNDNQTKDLIDLSKEGKWKTATGVVGAKYIFEEIKKLIDKKKQFESQQS